VYFGAHQILDFNVNLPAVLFVLALPIAFLDSTAEHVLPVLGQLRPTPSAARLLRAGAAAAVAVSLAGLIWQEVPAIENDRALGLANDGEWASARDLALAATNADPDITSFAFTAGLAEAHAGNHDAAAAQFRKVAVKDDLPEAWLNLAAEDLAAGHADQVQTSLGEALRLGYQRPAVAVPIGDLALRIGDRDLAIQAFTPTVVNTPSLLADPWWQSDPARASIYPDLVAAAIKAAPSVAWEVELMSGDTNASLAAAPDGSTTLFIRSWSGDKTALQQLLDSCRATPLDINLQLLCARAEGRAGNVDAANEFRYIADAQVGLSYSQGAELRVAKEEKAGRTLEGDPAIFWGTFTYRRPTPFDVLVPGVVHLTLE